MNAEHMASARQRVLAVTGALLEALYEPTAATVLANVKPGDMRPGGARVPGTSHELETGQAARVMRELLAIRGVRADGLLVALAEADAAARHAALTGKEPPRVASLYPYCVADNTVPGSESLESSLKLLYVAAHRIFTLTQMRRIDALCVEWKRQPELLDGMPVQQFVARWVRNTP